MSRARQFLKCNWNQGIVCCTCGHLLRENQSSRSILQWTLDLLSVPNYVIKKGRPHGIRLGNTEEQRKHVIAHNLRKRCIKKGFEGIHHRFQNDPTLRESLLSIDRTEEVCIQKDFTCRMTEDEYFRYKKNWWISLNKSGKIGLMRERSDFNEALTKLHRLHLESGEGRHAPIPYWQYKKWQPSSSSSSTSWWQWNDSWWNS